MDEQTIFMIGIVVLVCIVLAVGGCVIDIYFKLDGEKHMLVEEEQPHLKLENNHIDDVYLPSIVIHTGENKAKAPVSVDIAYKGS